MKRRRIIDPCDGSGARTEPLSIAEAQDYQHGRTRICRACHRAIGLRIVWPRHEWPYGIFPPHSAGLRLLRPEEH